MSFRQKNAAKRAAKREAARRSAEFCEALAFERGIITKRKSEAEYFGAGQTRRPKHKPAKASARTQSYYAYYYETLNID